MAAREAIMQTGYVPGLLALQDTPDYRAAYPRYYTAKYKGLVWSLIVLAEHRAPLTPRIAAQCEYLLQNAQELTDGGFAQSTAQRTGGGRLSEVIPCLTGNLMWCFYTLGLGGDPRVQRGLDWLVRNLRLNDGALLDPPAPAYRETGDVLGRAHLPHGRGQGTKGLRGPCRRSSAPPPFRMPPRGPRSSCSCTMWTDAAIT